MTYKALQTVQVSFDRALRMRLSYFGEVVCQLLRAQAVDRSGCRFDRRRARRPSGRRTNTRRLFSVATPLISGAQKADGILN